MSLILLFLSVFNTNRPAESITKLAQTFLCLTLNKKMAITGNM